MKNLSLFTSASICLTAIDAEDDARAFSAWTQDSCYIALSEDMPSRPLSKAQAKEAIGALIKEEDTKRDSFWFGIRALDDEELLGIIGFPWVDWSNGATSIAISMKDWVEYSRASTREALALLQEYAFREIQMHRLGISIPAYNKILISTVQALGFEEEVRRRKTLYRFGCRWDNLHLGLLASNWQNGEQNA
ncbi:MAG: GNAT family N-acetyltransferase [Anaerolineae bacterium]|jgi:RimJ/RimL family protein N-acetyltransferase|nr:GNAT family N-acetyltransferase [Anaerolineae bacterium]MBT4309216.1 GNAT family N-acetyltransferase [Anaerolineae bacterium]MBT4459304.1 GNAT family N-acetyltransferase [Anaerolineae bacterium]MBT4841200.1 GNAT family N-acetyltransferase [Anaerolineae bacterium]MBT6062574.1 GNAT family N-acetyltransferase [Anaerolineae bacterium]